MGEKIQSFCNNVSVLFRVHTACVYDMYQYAMVYTYTDMIYRYTAMQVYN